MSRYVKTNIPNLVRDTQTGALINNDMGELRGYLQAREKAKRIKAVETELAELKELVKGILNKNGT